MVALPIMVRGSRELLSGSLLVAGGEVQTWQGGAGGRWRREVGVVGFNFKMFKLGGRSSQDQSLLLFPNLKFSLSVILRVLSVLEKGSHDLKVLAMLD